MSFKIPNKAVKCSIYIPSRTLCKKDGLLFNVSIIEFYDFYLFEYVHQSRAFDAFQ